MSKIPLDAVPDITNNQVQVVTQSPALTAEEVEQFITYPIELNMTNLPGVEDVRSISKYGLSIVTIIFNEDVADLDARQLVAEQIQLSAAEIPAEMGTPEMMPISTGLGEIYQYVLRVDPDAGVNYTTTELREWQDWVVKRQLNGIPGIIEISSFGGAVKQYEVVPDPIKLAEHGVSISDLEQAISGGNHSSGGSYVAQRGQAFYIRASGRITDIEAIEQVPLFTSESNRNLVKVKDVADVGVGNAVRFGAMTMDGIGEVVGGITLMLKGENANATVQRVRDRVEGIQSSLPPGLSIEPYLDRSALVARTTATVSKNLIEGGAIVIFVLVLLLGNWRAGLVVASVIPLSMLFALFLMNLFGVSANLMSLGAIDFGIVVDGAVIVTEHVLAVLTAGYLGKTLSRDQFENLISKSAVEMIKSAVFGVVIILVVFLPVISLVGIEGKMFKPMAQTVSFALVGALLLSITYVPSMLALVLKKEGRKEPKLSRGIMEMLINAYTPVLRWSLRRGKVIMAMALLLFTGAIVLFTSMGSEFIPKLDEGDLAMQLQLPSGTSLEESIATTTAAEKLLLAEFPQVKQVVSKIGTAEVPTDPMSIEQADMMVLLEAPEDWPVEMSKNELIRQMEERLKTAVPYGLFEFTQPIELRFNELISGAKSDVAVKVFGPDFKTLSEVAEQMVPLLQEIEGAVDVKREQTDGLNQLTLAYDRGAMNRLGVTMRDVNDVIQGAFAGRKAGVVYEEDRKFDIVIRYAGKSRNYPDLNRLFVTNSKGTLVPLSAFSSFEYASGPAMISRENSQRRVTVGFNVRGKDIESVVHDVQNLLEEKLELPNGYYISYGGDFEQLQQAKKRLSVAIPAALLAIFVLLYFSFHSLKNAVIIFIAVPMSAIGGVAALYLRDMPFSISAGIGFIALFGVAVLNGIVMVSHLNKMERLAEGGQDWVISASLQRLRPVVMTALVAALGFLPMALSTGAGAEVQKPLATVVIGGLVTATLLTLVVLPVIYKSAQTWGRRGVSVLRFLWIPLALSLPQLHAQESRSFNDALMQLQERGLEVQKAKVMKSQTRLENAADWRTPVGIDYQMGQINGLERNDYNVSAALALPSLTSLPALSKLHKARMSYAEANIDYARAVQAYRLEQYWLMLWEATRRQEILESHYSQAKVMMDWVQQRTKAGLMASRDSLVWGANVEALHHEVNHSIMEVHRIKSEINSLCLWQNEEDWVPNFSGIAALTPKPRIKAEASLIIGLNQAEYAQIDQVSKLEQSKWLPELRAGVFSQKIDGTPGFNGLVLGTQIPLSPKTYSNKVKYTRLEEQRYASELLAATAAWEQHSAYLYEVLRLWSVDEHHKNIGVQSAEELWNAFQGGGVDLMGLWERLDAQYTSKLLDLEHEANYLKWVSEWNFYQKEK